MTLEWSEADNGNYHGFELDYLEATVFEKTANEWSGVWTDHSLFLRGRFSTSEKAIEALEQAIEEGKSSKLWATPNTTAWSLTKIKNGQPGFWRKHNGKILSVRKSKGTAWTATLGQGGMVMNGNQPRWFSSADEAKKYLDDLVDLPS